jgi:hypothetical protein
MALFGGNDKNARCPVCGGRSFFSVPVGRADTWNQQVDKHPQWKVNRGLPEKAPVAFHEPRLEWDQPTFDPYPTPTGHLRCSTCASLIPPQFLGPPKSRVLLITFGMPEAGKTTWLKCLFHPAKQRYLIVEPSSEIGREPYDFVEPYTIDNPDPRTAVPFLLHGTRLTFQRAHMQVAGIDIKGEVFHQRNTAPDKMRRVRMILRNLRDTPFADLFFLFVVPFDASCTRQNIGQLDADLVHEPGARGTWQGVLWTHLDQAKLHDPNALFAFLQGDEAALALAQRAVAGSDELFKSDFESAAAEIERLVHEKRNWTNDLALLESLTWLLYRLMLEYSSLPARLRRPSLEFYFTYSGGVGSILVRHCMRMAAALFAAWDRAGCGDFAPMVRESMMPGSDLLFPVLPCGLEFRGQDDEGLPVWGDLLLLEILRRHV